MTSNDRSRPPRSLGEELPSRFADRLGQWYLDARSTLQRKALGQYFTSAPLADFMASQLDPVTQPIRVLDPAAGSGTIICSAIEAILASSPSCRRIEIVAFEVDQSLAIHLNSAMNALTKWARARGVKVRAQVRAEDFLLSQASRGPTPRFDVVVANPPYFKIRRDDPRALAFSSVVGGQPNIYALFMAATALSLNKSAQVVYLVPRSFASGKYFTDFRREFFSMVTPVAIHRFDSRKTLFGRDRVLQESILFHGLESSSHCSDAGVRISSSLGLGDLSQRKQISVARSLVLPRRTQRMTLRIPSTPAAERVLRLLDEWETSIEGLGFLVSTGPVVPFRLPNRAMLRRATPNARPLLWLQNIHAMDVQWPGSGTRPPYLNGTVPSAPLVPVQNMVLVRRFSPADGARRVVAAPLLVSEFDHTEIGIENHINYIYRPHQSMTRDEAVGLAAFLNSETVDAYLGSTIGSTQVSAEDLRTLPVPPLSTIRRLARSVRPIQRPSGHSTS